MNWLVALATGIGIGLACFGSLWLTVRRAVRTPQQRQCRRRLVVGQCCRVALCALAFCLLSRNGAGTLLSALGGFWVARWHLIQRLGVVGHGE